MARHEDIVKPGQIVKIKHNKFIYIIIALQVLNIIIQLVKK
jgi:hypothetical protein